MAHNTSPEAEQYDELEVGPDLQGGRLREAGDRIQTLLEAASAGGAVARERAEELVRLVADLYGAGLERMLALLRDSGRLDDELLATLADDDLVASLLIVHGLHPHDVTTRVEAALESVRPYLGTHGGDVELLDVSGDGVVRLRLLGSCDGCPSSSVTLKLAVEGAVEAAAPEITAIEVDAGESGNGTGGVISVDALRSRLDAETTDGVVNGSTWQPVPELADLRPGELAGFSVGGLSIFGCRVGADVLVFRDRCGRCEQSLAGATLARRLGGALDAPLLVCPSCRTHYDVRHAGVGVDIVEDGAEEVQPHLHPLPVLVRDGVLQVAAPVGVPG